MSRMLPSLTLFIMLSVVSGVLAKTVPIGSVLNHLMVGKGGLPPLLERHQHLGGGEPPFPTCETPHEQFTSVLEGEHFGGDSQDKNKSDDRENLDRRVRAEVGQFKGKVSLFAKNLDTGAIYDLNGDERVQTASTIKIAVLIEAFARVSEGKSKWSDELVLTKEKKVGGAGILPEFGDGLRLTLRDAVTLMMVLSDNTATNLVIDVLTADAINARMESLGLRETRLMRRVFGGGESAEGRKEENKRFGLGRTTLREMVTIMEKLERGEIVSAAASKEMLELMKREQGTNGIWRNQWRVPKATKSGALDALRSNVGIIYHPSGRIALAITCHEMPEVNWTVDNPAMVLMSRLSEIIVDGLGKQTTSPAKE